ncbi:4-hydroxythreonine-4-phosphate dehydrogenase PdxA [Planktosalinus lacus]|uniref:4-hydroxythreonine-4-phosphate dehydrogenase n=1 Tax=Planktosalinus lacus TaxID=1526573 RepID=A0A8J2Y4K9_9FLAO|nr:4-hydroxythreonine-4-phosphate dehydrogenase PdxA [Planktosalinus lacus]GGD80492.1 4-hydroxythreonine-4-phosphate dehydrogenase [Planktosalinus lacus]
MSKQDSIIVGISIGDLNGIGPEIVLKTFEDPRMLEFCTPVIFASVKTMSLIKKALEINVNFQGIDHLNKLVHGKVNILNVWRESADISFGTETPMMGEYAIKSLQAAVKALKTDEVDVLVTAPVNKHNIQSEKFKFPGHTDYLAQELGGESLMFMVSDTLRVGLLTDHIPVNEISKHITKSLIEKKINLIHAALKQDFRVTVPKIAVLGINPHTGDNGVIGKEDDEVLRPTLQKINHSGKIVYGPYAADSFFGSGNYKNFDAIVAAYHDQGLIPFKTISFGSGVNFTAGLSKVRTSPDHGTAYDIAGKNEADFTSFREAVFKAIQIYNNRKEYLEISKNPLKPSGKKLSTKKG